jgi:lysophospholipase L1-like esterase
MHHEATQRPSAAAHSGHGRGAGARHAGPRPKSLLARWRAFPAPGRAFLAPGRAFLAPGRAFLAPGRAFLAPGRAFLAPGRAFLARGRRFRVAAVAAVAGGALLAALLPAAASASGTSYVALGDSYTSGPLIPYLTGTPAGCLRSSHDYPALVAAAIGAASFTDVSCSGASTVNMAGSESVAFGTNPPQLNAVKASTTLVTLGIGGNDIGFSDIVLLCSSLSFLNPFGAPCKKHYTAGGIDRLAEAVAQTGPKVAAILEDIHSRAPAARVLLVGYPALLPATGDGCWPLAPFAHGDVPYLRGVELKLNQMLASEAAAHGATYVDTYTDSTGHTLCNGLGTKWIEGIVPTSLAAPVHPNAPGEKAMARQVLAALG